MTTDRIDIVTIGTWNALIRPNGVQLNFGWIYSSSPLIMNTVQIVNKAGVLVTAVHNIASDEVISFPRMTSAIGRIICYPNGVGVETPPFYVYEPVLKTAVTAAELAAFQKLHPLDASTIVDFGSVKNFTLIFP
jgi:hypothetical protein